MRKHRLPTGSEWRAELWGRRKSRRRWKVGVKQNGFTMTGNTKGESQLFILSVRHHPLVGFYFPLPFFLSLVGVSWIAPEIKPNGAWRDTERGCAGNVTLWRCEMHKKRRAKEKSKKEWCKRATELCEGGGEREGREKRAGGEWQQNEEGADDWEADSKGGKEPGEVLLWFVLPHRQVSSVDRILFAPFSILACCSLPLDFMDLLPRMSHFHL